MAVIHGTLFYHRNLWTHYAQCWKQGLIIEHAGGERVPSDNSNTLLDEGSHTRPQPNWQGEDKRDAKTRCIWGSHPVGISLVSGRVDLSGSHGATAAAIQQEVLQYCPVEQAQVQISQIPSPYGIQKAWCDAKSELQELLYGGEGKRVTFVPDVIFKREEGSSIIHKGAMVFRHPSNLNYPASNNHSAPHIMDTINNSNENGISTQYILNDDAVISLVLCSPINPYPYTDGVKQATWPLYGPEWSLSEWGWRSCDRSWNKASPDWK